MATKKPVKKGKPANGFGSPIKKSSKKKADGKTTGGKKKRQINLG